MDSHTIENFGNKGISAIGAVLAGQNRGPYTRNRVYNNAVQISILHLYYLLARLIELIIW